jgi:hypothetical protein
MAYKDRDSMTTDEIGVRGTASDTVRVTTDGRTEVDIQKLFKKQHIRSLIDQMQSKIRYVQASSREAYNRR